jgi:tetratricopeptide (TPR) repeat protein/predicted Ser/Thr protein kinase
MWVLLWYWDGLLGIPLRWLNQYLEIDVATPWKVQAWKVGFSVALLLFAYEIYLRIWRFNRRRLMLKDSTPVAPPESASLAKDTEFMETLEAVKAPEQTIAALKKAKRYDRLGEIYVALTRHKEAAWAFQKAGDLKRSAIELAKAGKTLKAAKVLEKAGDHATAARFYAEKGKHLKAARALRQAGDLPNAAEAFMLARKPAEAATALAEYFASTREPAPAQLQAADKCYQLLQNETFKAKADEETTRTLTLAVAERYATAERADLAAQLFVGGGDPGRAADLYLRTGRMQEAAQCLQAAGRTREAALIGARYYESRTMWREAGAAYESAGEYVRAGDCFSKASDALRASACYEKAGEYYGAGFALVYVKLWERAIPVLQKVREDAPRYAESRALLGRCFYEMGQYEHCIATLENHLTGERVRTGNIEYFWMLALAYEQLGKLDESRQVLLKIQSVSVGFRDVSQRLSSISSRISMGQSGESPVAAPAADGAGPPPTAIMNMVENSLGQRYRLDRELGRGGMGVVFQAHDTQLDRPVALKFLGTMLDGSEEFRKRFVREAQTAAKVSHPNIVAIYDIGASEGKAYIAMEYVDGLSLRRYIDQKGRIEPREAVNLMVQACSALDAIHQAGIVHRDLKPDNILLAKGGLLKLMDFGLAKGQGARLTGTNVVMGTPSYMAPEQILGEEADARSDIYSLGLVLHEMLTGQIVFAEGDVLARQQNEVPPPPGKTVPGIPSMLDQIVMKCIAKRREERFASVRELTAYLRQVKNSA